MNRSMKRKAICQECGQHMRGYERVGNVLLEEACKCGDPANSVPVFGTPEWDEWRANDG